MSQSVQQRKRTTRKTAGRATPKPAQVRPVAAQKSNHAQAANDRWERQAQEASSKIMKGEEGIAHHLTPAPAASYAGKMSAGQPLPRNILEELEQGFGADLRAVRIHNNPIAACAAAREGARAFAAGCDIYFSSGGFHPSSSAGRLLLSHEIAHVLQQTGRRTAQGRMAATNLSGYGSIQCDSIPGTSPPASDQLLEHLTRIHTSQLTGAGQARVREVVADLNRRLGALEWGVANDAGLEIQRETIAGQYNGHPRAVRSFLFDCLKCMGEGGYQSAAKLIHDDYRIKSSFSHDVDNDFYQFLESEPYGNSWVARILSQHPVSRRFWPNAFLQSIWVYLINPSRQIQALYGDLAGTRRRELENAVNWQVLGENERLLYALDLLQALDQGRLIALRRIERRIRLTDPMARKRAIALGVRQWGRGMRNHSGEISYLNSMGQRIEGLGQRAINFWTRVITRRDETRALVRGINTSDITNWQRSSVLQELPDHERFTTLQGLLHQHTLQLFHTNEDGSLLSIRSYFGRRNRFLRALRGQRRAFEQTLRNVYSRDNAGEQAEQLGHWLGWTLYWLQLLISELAAYRRPSDIRQSRRHRTSDYRRAHRIVLSRLLLRFSLLTGWRNIESLANDVLTAAVEGESVLALVSDWRPQRDVPFSRMGEECRRSVMSTTMPLTIRQLVQFFNTIYTERFADRLQGILQSEESVINSRHGSMFQRARAEADRLDVPVRWRVENFEFAINPNDEQDTSDLIINHPKTRRQLLSRIEQLGAWVFPIDRINEVFVWVIPSLDRFILMLTDVPELNEIVRSQGVDPQINRENPDQLLRWFQALSGAQDTYSTIRERITATVSREQDTQSARLPNLYRRVTTFNRRVLACSLREDLTAYSGNEIENYSIPTRAINRIREFRYNIRPVEDVNLQLAALILEIAPAIRAAFIREGWFGTTVERRYDIITSYFEYLITARDQAATEEARSQLRTILHSGENHQQLETNQGAITEVIRAFNRVRTEIQCQSGFQSINGNSLKSLQFNQEIVANGPPFEIGGSTYQLLQVFQEFTYHPPYGAGTSAPLQPIIKDGQGQEMARQEDPLFRILINGEPVLVTTSADKQNEEYLNRISSVVADQAFVMNLENLGRQMERAADVVLTVVELVPGVGLGVTVARITTGVAQFVISDLPTIRRELLEEPEEMVNRIVSGIRDSITPERLWDYLVLSGPNPLARRSQRRRRRPRFGRPRGRLGRLVQSVRRVENHFIGSLGHMKRRIQRPLISAQSRVASRPRVAFALRAIPGVLTTISTMDLDDRRAELEGLIEHPQALADSLTSLLEGLQEMELPSEVIPMELAVETVVVFFLERFGARGRLLRLALENIGVLDDISEPIANGLRQTSADPNRIWRTDVLPQLERKFIMARNDLVNMVYTLVAQALRGIPGATVPSLSIDQLPDVAIQTASHIPEIQPYPTTVEVPLPANMPSPSISNGVPLTGLLRTDVESRFGHDFSHVRLHRGHVARAMTSVLGTPGLTSGSHILLRPDIAITSGSGRDIFNHELAHVLQQAGPRPLNAHYSSRSVWGKPGRGISVDSVRESAAERVAQQASRLPSKPVKLESSGGEGFFPNLRGVSLQLLEKFAEPGFGERLQRSVERTTVTGSVPGLPQARQIWQDVNARIQEVRDRDYLPFARSVKNQIRDHINGHGSAIATAIRALANRAQRNLPRSQGQQTIQTELVPRRFINLLQEYIFARTGIGMDIDLSTVTPHRMANIRIHYVHLAEVEATSPLWNAVKTSAGFPGSTPQEKETNRRQIHARLQVLGPVPYVWFARRSGFKFSRRFLREFWSLRRQESNVTTLPAWENYTDTRRPGSDKSGLRVGLHGDLLGAGSHNRQSHHTTQYLLVQYFRNETTPRLFGPSNNRRLPGFFPVTASMQDQFRANAGTINLRSLDPTSSGRGIGMPAILIATETHQRGRLHITQERSAANNDGKRKSQARTVDNVFQAQLPNRLRRNASEATFQSFVSQSPQRAKRAVYNAMQDTYRWMYTRNMQPALQRALRREEVAYYSGMAARDHNVGSSDRLQPEYNPEHSTNRNRIRQVIQSAENNNNRVMSRAGWRLS